MNKDISTTEDIKFLIDQFYIKVRTDQTIGYIFNEVANVNWDSHLPKMYSFWETMILSKGTYKGNPMQIHIDLNKTESLTKQHFKSWITLWVHTVNEHFDGPKAQEAIKKATSIKSIMQAKMLQNKHAR